jgi:SAM-dependent methyltransferase
MSDPSIIASFEKPKCPACGQKGEMFYGQLPDRLFGATGRWNFYRCPNKNCRLLWLNPCPTEGDISKAYAKYYTHSDFDTNVLSFLRGLVPGYWAIKYGYNEHVGFFKKLIGSLLYLFPTERIEADFDILYLHARDRGRLLDVGCGNGLFISRMQKLGWQTQGIDLDTTAAEFCRSKGLNVSSGDLASQHFSENSFDVITINHVIEHIHDYTSLIKECKRILKPGGKLLVATPNGDSRLLKNKFGLDWFSLDPPRHLHIFNVDNLQKVITENGFGMECVKTTARNESWVFIGSRSIQKNGVFEMSAGKQSKFSHLRGRVAQFTTQLVLLVNKKAGGEVVIKAVKS